MELFPVFKDNLNFIAWSTEHKLILIFCCLFGWAFIRYAKNKNSGQQELIVFYFSILILVSQLLKIPIKIALGTFQLNADLPLHLCNILPLFLPFVMKNRARNGWAVLYLFIMAGTFQSLITPTIDNSLPHFDAIRYWLVHAGLVIVMLYGVFVFNFRLQWKDVIKAFLAINVLATIIYILNLLLDANYMYLVAKPSGGTIMDQLGDWPIYILQLELLVPIFFLLLVLPFKIPKRLYSSRD